MEFYGSRVYTALNADDLKIGSKCIFANTLEELRQRVQAVNVEDCTKKSSNWYYDANIKYFVSDTGTWIYAYLIAPPAEVGFRNKEKISEKINDLQIVHLSLRDIKEIARYAGLTIDTENLPDDITQHENCFLALFTYSDHSTEKVVEYKSAPQRGRTEYATMAGIIRSAQMYLMINGKTKTLADDIWRKYTDQKQLAFGF